MMAKYIPIFRLLNITGFIEICDIQIQIGMQLALAAMQSVFLIYDRTVKSVY